MRALASGGLVILVLVGCYEPPDACGITCVDTCPGDLVCTNNVCQPTSGEQCTLPPIDFALVTVGGRHVCGLDVASEAWCWGDNDAGQLGVDSMAYAMPRPAKVEGTWATITTGGEHTCALRDGAPWCWGSNERGQVRAQLGGTVPAPIAVPFGPSVRPAFDQLAAGGLHSCALGAGQLWCWGDATTLGNGGVETSVAIRIGMLGDWTAVSLGADHSCGVSASMGVLCWGGNDRAQSVSPQSGTVLTPTVVTGLPAGAVLAIEAGRYDSCAVIATAGGATGELWCWGDSYLITGTNNSYLPPTQIGLDADWSSVTIGVNSICGTLRGRVFCWGDASYGGLPSGLWSDQRAYAEALDVGVVDQLELAPRAYTGFSARGGCHRVGTTVSCWGQNQHGQAGVGTFGWSPSPVEVMPPAGRTWARVWSGSQHSCATTDDGQLHCWGANEQGQVAAGTPRGEMIPCVPDEPCDFSRPVPAPVALPAELVVGRGFTCARTDATVECWGDPIDGHLGVVNPNNGVTTVAPAGGGQFTRLLGDGRATCGLVDDGRLQCWGLVVDQPRSTPFDFSDPVLQNLMSITFAEDFACAVLADGTRACIGGNSEGQFGDGTQNSQATPTVFANPPITALAARFRTTCVVTTTGEIACTGRNDAGQAGSTNMPELSMSRVLDSGGTELAGCTAVAVESGHACAICGGRPMCWGRGEYGQLGRGVDALFSTRRAGPVELPPGLTFTGITVFGDGGCALSDDGRVFCWGDSARGQVGAGGSAYTTPVAVGSP